MTATKPPAYVALITAALAAIRARGEVGRS